MDLVYKDTTMKVHSAKGTDAIEHTHMVIQGFNPPLNTVNWSKNKMMPPQWKLKKIMTTKAIWAQSSMQLWRNTLRNTEKNRSKIKKVDNFEVKEEEP